MSKIKVGCDIVSGASKFASKIGIPLKNWHLPKHNYTGPFTELDKRVDKEGNPLPGFEPYNQIDEIALHHDWNYKKADEGIGTRHEADKKMLDELNAIKFKNFRERLDYALVKPIIWLKYKLGLGLHDNLHLAQELHKPVTRKFKRRRVFVFNINDIWSADLKDMQSLAKHNNGYKYLLNVIDLFSKYAYSIPLKTKTSKEIIEAFEKLFDSKHPNRLWTDQGSEFINNNFKKFLADRNIILYHVYNEGKAAVIERFNRTIGEMIQKHLTSSNSNKYIDVLQNLIHDYNSRTHSTIKMSPIDASKFENRAKVIENYNYDFLPSSDNPKFKPGDRVRISIVKNTFEKGYTPNWSKEIFVIDKVKRTNPITYSIRDLNNESILGSFYNQELQHTQL